MSIEVDEVPVLSEEEDDEDIEDEEDEVGSGEESNESNEEEEGSVEETEVEDELESEEEDEATIDEESSEAEEASTDEENDDVSFVSADAAERRYLISSESFTRLKDPGLASALLPKEHKPEKTYHGTKQQKNDYKNLCDQLGVIPCSAFIENIRNSSMDLGYMGLNAQQIKAICLTLIPNKYVKRLDLRGSDCGGEAGEALVELMSQNTNIIELIVPRTNIQKCLKGLCEGIAGQGIVEILDLSRNDLNSKDLSHIAKILKHKEPEGVLRELYLSRNFFMDDGLVSLGNALSENGTLEILDLSFNRFWGSKESIPFFERAGWHEHLRHLDLQGNSLKDPSGSGIGRMLSNGNNGKRKGGNVLEHVNIAHNLLSERVAGGIGSGFGNNRTMKELICGPNRWNCGVKSQGNLVPMLNNLSGYNAIPSGELLDLSPITAIHQQYIKAKGNVLRNHPTFKIMDGEPFGFNDGNRPDPKALMIHRAKVICENFETPIALLIDELRTEPETMTPKEFKKFIKSCNLYKDKKLTKELMDNFPSSEGIGKIDCKSIIAAFDKEFPRRILGIESNHEGTGEDQEQINDLK